MHKLSSIIVFRLKLILKSKAAVLMLFLLPIIFSLIFGGIGLGNQGNVASKINVGVIVQECEACEPIYQYLSRNSSYNWQIYDLEAGKDAVTEQLIVAAIIVPENIMERIVQSQPVFDVIVNHKTEGYIPLSNFIDGVANQLHMYSKTLSMVDQQQLTVDIINYVNSIEPVKLEHESYQARVNSEENNPSTSTTMSVGFAVMFMLFAISNSASTIHQERKEYTWQRLIISGTSSSVISFGTMIAYFIVGWMQFATVILFMRFAFNVNWGNITYLILFASLMIMTVVSFSMLLVSLVSSKEKADTLSTIIVVSTCMLGGVYWPIDFVPPVMQAIGMLTPQYWMMKGLQYGLVNETSLSVIWQPIAVLLLATVVFTTIVVTTLSKEKKLA